MKLNKIYTSPVKLFDEVEFHDGLNIIYAYNPVPDQNEESTDDDKKNSLHGVGKSTFLDFILFALLVDLKSSCPRLYNAYKNKILNGISVVLEFSVNKTEYRIKRSFDNPNSKIYFGPGNKPLPDYNIGKLREKLFELIFNRPDYPGEINPNWYYKLLSFFIKVKRKDEIFSDPIHFSQNINELLQTPFHLSLLNIDNSLPLKHRELLESIQKSESFLSDQENYVKEQNKIKDLTALQEKKAKAVNDMYRLQRIIKSFSLAENYTHYEQQADELTAEIKKMWFSNAVERKKLEGLKEYEKNMPAEVYQNLDHITNVYNEINSLLAGNVRKTIQEALDFRQNLHSSRKEFIEMEKGRLNNNIYSREQKISSLEAARKEILNNLSGQSALDDLTVSYSKLAQIQQQLADITSSLKSIDKIKGEIIEKNNQHALVLDNIETYLNNISTAVDEFRALLLSVYNELFLDSHSVKIFNVEEVEEKQKIKISVLEGSIMDSTGKNQCRTLIYDFSVLLNILKQNINAPRFLVHDGIFENLDKSHFFAFISFIEELLAKDNNFQYILTLNEHDFLDEIKDYKKEKIINNAVIELTPDKTLLSRNF